LPWEKIIHTLQYQTSKLDCKDQEKKKKSSTYPFNNTLIDFITSARIKQDDGNSMAPSFIQDLFSKPKQTLRGENAEIPEEFYIKIGFQIASKIFRNKSSLTKLGDASKTTYRLLNVHSMISPELLCKVKDQQALNNKKIYLDLCNPMYIESKSTGAIFLMGRRLY